MKYDLSTLQEAVLYENTLLEEYNILLEETNDISQDQLTFLQKLKKYLIDKPRDVLAEWFEKLNTMMRDLQDKYDTIPNNKRTLWQKIKNAVVSCLEWISRKLNDLVARDKMGITYKEKDKELKNRLAAEDLMGNVLDKIEREARYKSVDDYKKKLNLQKDPSHMEVLRSPIGSKIYDQNLKDIAKRKYGWDTDKNGDIFDFHTEFMRKNTKFSNKLNR